MPSPGAIRLFHIWQPPHRGALYRFAFSLVIYLAKGGPKSGDAPYVILSGIAAGGLIGVFILLLAVKKF